MENNLINVDFGHPIEVAVLPFLRHITKWVRLTGKGTVSLFFGQDARLEASDGSDYRRLWEGTTRIGRGKLGNQIPIMNDDASVSRKHIAITIESPKGDSMDHTYTLQVLSKRHNTKLNGKILSPGDSVEIKHNDIIILGNIPLVFKTDPLSEEKKPTVSFS